MFNIEVHDMKKLLVGFALLFSVSAVFGQGSSPGRTLKYTEFLNVNSKYGYVVLTNNTTLLYGETNVIYIDGVGKQVQALGTNYVNPNFIQTGVTNGPTNLNFQVYAEFPYTGVTIYYTNTTYTNSQLFPQAWDNNFAWMDANGNPSSNTVYVTASLDSAASTNAYTLTLVKGQDDGKFDYLGNNVFTFTFPLSGLTNTTVHTNMPLWFVGGARKYQLWKVVSANSTTNALGYLKGVAIVSP